MRDNNLNIGISELVDEEGKVYVFRIPTDVRESTIDWFNTEFPDMWNHNFRHSRYITIPGSSDEGFTVTNTNIDELQKLIEDMKDSEEE